MERKKKKVILEIFGFDSDKGVGLNLGFTVQLIFLFSPFPVTVPWPYRD